MRPFVATFRVLIATGLIASPGLNGLCCCAGEKPSSSSTARVTHRSDACSCGSKSAACCGSAQCNCAGDLPQVVKTQAVLDRTLDDVAELAVVPNMCNIGQASVKPWQFDAHPAGLAGSIANLVAQGTRLNI